MTGIFTKTALTTGYGLNLWFILGTVLLRLAKISNSLSNIPILGGKSSILNPSSFLSEGFFSILIRKILSRNLASFCIFRYFGNSEVEALKISARN